MASPGLSSAAKQALAALVVASALMIAPHAAFAEKTLGVSSGAFRYEVDSGSKVGGEIIVSNDGDEPITVLVYAADQVVDETGALSFTVPNRADISTMNQPSAWIRLDMPTDSKSFANVPYLEMEPGERVPVQFEVSVPGGVASGDHNVMVFFEMAELPTEENQLAQMRVSGRIGSRVTLRVSGDIVERLEVRPFTVPSVVFGPAVPFEFRVMNAGNVDERVTSTALLLDGSDNTVATQVAIDNQTVFAGRNLDASGTVSAARLGFGPHTVRVETQKVDESGAVLDAGKDTIVETRTTWVLPVWLLVAVAVLVLLVVGLIAGSVASRRRKTAAAAPAAAPEADQSSAE